MNWKTLALLTLLPLPAAAFPPLPPDLDEDGRISREEWQEAGAMRFRAVDRDLDGRLTPEEQRLLRPRRFHLELPPPSPDAGDCMRDGVPSRAKRIIAGPLPPEPPRDEDGNGNIERAEMDAASARSFAALDADADGWLDPKELRPDMPSMP